MNMNTIESVIEGYVRQSFQISPDDPGFTRSVDLFESGYVDSVGVIELLAFVTDEFGVEVPDSALLSERFATIDGMAEVIRDVLSAEGSRSSTRSAAMVNGAERPVAEAEAETRRQLESAK
jgi:acyl carrier protein